LTLTPLAICCPFSGSIYLNIYTGFVAVPQHLSVSAQVVDDLTWGMMKARS
jgi:hypothetical protein